MNGYMKKMLVAMLVGLMIISLMGCGETTTPEKVENGAQTTGGDQTSEEQGSKATQNENSNAPETFKIGDPIKMGDLIFIVNSIRESNGNDFIKPEEGKVYKIADVTLENVGKESTSVSSMLMFSLSDADGYKYNITIGPDAKGSVDGELQPGRKHRGEVAFEVSKEAKGLELIFEPNLFGSGQAIVQISE